MDPHAVLGVTPDASDEELARAYRDLAKQHHPDRAGADAAAQMQQLNEAYSAVRAARRRSGARTRRRVTVKPPGWWLGDEVRAQLGAELVGALDERERVLAVALAASGDSHDVRLALTEKRLLWLRNDAIVDRVRAVRLAEVDEAEARLGRVRSRGELRVRARTRRRRLRFGEMAPDALRELSGALADLLPAGVVRLPPPAASGA